MKTIVKMETGLWRCGNRLFLSKSDAYYNRRQTPANYDALEFGYSEIDDSSFYSKLLNGEIRGIRL